MTNSSITVNDDITSSKEHANTSPLSLYSEYQRLGVELRTPVKMNMSHWHGQVEINVPFDDSVEYLINGELVKLKPGHITMFWACVPHRLTNPRNCCNMAIFTLPMHLFLSWPINHELVNYITHGRVVQSNRSQQICEFEILRWQDELGQRNEQIRQIAIDEIGLMIKRFGLSGWTPLLTKQTSKTLPNGVSKHAQFYVSQMLEYIAKHHSQPLSIQDISNHVELNQNYAMGIFQRVMQLTIKQYITAMRINHTRVLLSESDKSILDIALTAGFSSSSRFYDCFKKYVGLTPRKYRILCQGKNDNISTPNKDF
ncbi:TPA: transcriptional regulator MelR [Vibrio parahaemolyticus]|uniref:transcriptional regulator MelR n=1 Tax=Vibrio harveyi group TaxID=717610 RepID=UPI0003AA0B79|nr:MULTISPECIES: transcriptional regulator MelR [Vibrio harveyi group]MCR9817688.1 transcriptional regulator MelR [Vibrio parahaemolyticus]HBC3930665.1 transcriptional regulator MelR [Vibrio parahaemolyticus]